MGSSDDDESLVAWGELLAETQALLSSGGTDNPFYCARLITEEALGLEGAEFLEALGTPATVRGVAKLDSMVARRLRGEPVQYVIGHWPFRSLDLFIDRRVLIPRPETETVAGVAIDLAKQMGAGVLVADLGTGSGAIGLSIASEVERSQVWLTDQSSDALEVARANLAGLGSGATQVRISHGSWFEALAPELKGRFGLVVSNPPYVATTDHLDSEVKDWEPVEALLSGTDGLDDLRVVIAQAPEWLTPDGALVLEIAPSQASVVAAMCREAFTEIEVVKDLPGRDRAVSARIPR